MDLRLLISGALNFPLKLHLNSIRSQSNILMLACGGCKNLKYSASFLIPMRITIDTKEDTPEDIQRILHILTGILNRKETISNEPANEPVDTTNLMSIFSNPAPQKESLDLDNIVDRSHKAADLSTFMELTQKRTEIKRTSPRVEIF